MNDPTDIDPPPLPSVFIPHGGGPCFFMPDGANVIIGKVYSGHHPGPKVMIFSIALLSYFSSLIRILLLVPPF